MYLYRSSTSPELVPYNQAKHGYPCEYLGGDSGIPINANDYQLVYEADGKAVFLHSPTGMYYPAVQVGLPSWCVIGDDWEQAQADLMIPAKGLRTGPSLMLAGPFVFYNLAGVLESGPVRQEEARAAGYCEEDAGSVRGRLHFASCATPEEARRLLVLIDA